MFFDFVNEDGTAADTKRMHIEPAGARSNMWVLAYKSLG